MTFKAPLWWSLWWFKRATLLMLFAVNTGWAAAPCVNATPACTEWINIAGGPMRAMVYRSHALQAREEGVTRAVVMVHGGSRDAHSNFMHVLAASFVAGALENTA